MKIKPVLRLKFLFSLCIIAISFPSHAQTISQKPLDKQPSRIALREQPLPSLTSQDQQSFEQLMEEAQRLQLPTKSWTDTLDFFSFKLLGQPYHAGLLDQSSSEDLFLSLTKFDCVLFVETVLALAYSTTQTHTASQTSSVPFATQVQNLRYRNGVRDGYCSRLHYFSEWLDNNQTHGYLNNISQELGGIPLKKSLQFMSRHRNSYPQLKNGNTYDCIVQMENRLASLPMYYIPTSAIDQMENQLQPGDIIAVATSVPYLDVTHTGLIYQEQNGRKGLIHASPGGSVRLAKHLKGYVSQVDSAIGIMVARPIEPEEKTVLSQH